MLREFSAEAVIYRTGFPIRFQSPLRITYDATLEQGAEPSVSQIRIYNPDTQRAAEAIETGRTMEVFATLGAVSGRVVSGKIVNSTQQQDGVERWLEIDIYPESAELASRQLELDYTNITGYLLTRDILGRLGATPQPDLLRVIPTGVVERYRASASLRQAMAAIYGGAVLVTSIGDQIRLYRRGAVQVTPLQITQDIVGEIARESDERSNRFRLTALLSPHLYLGANLVVTDRHGTRYEGEITKLRQYGDSFDGLLATEITMLVSGITEAADTPSVIKAAMQRSQSDIWTASVGRVTAFANNRATIQPLIDRLDGSGIRHIRPEWEGVPILGGATVAVGDIVLVIFTSRTSAALFQNGQFAPPAMGTVAPDQKRILDGTLGFAIPIGV